MSKHDIPHWYVRDMLNYDPDTGVFSWRQPVGYIRIGDYAGAIDAQTGYVRVTLAGAAYKAHRLAWFYVNGVWPRGNIDHIDGDRSNNRWSNLREVTQQQNIQNSRKHRNSKCALKGVTPSRNGLRFIAQIRIDGKQRKLGTFDTIEEAHAAYCAAAKVYFGDFFCSG